VRPSAPALAPSIRAARVGPPGNATNTARLAALGLTSSDPALSTKLAALSNVAVTPGTPKTEYPAKNAAGTSGADFGASVTNVKLAAPATLAAMKARVPVAAAEIPKQARLNLIAGWPKPTSQFPFPEVAGLRLAQLGPNPIAIIETVACGTYEVQSTPIPAPVTYPAWDWAAPNADPVDPLTAAGLQVVRLTSFLSLVDTPQVGKLTLYGNGRFSTTINIPLNPFPNATTPDFSETVTVMAGRQGQGAVYCSAPWMCGPSKMGGLSPQSRLSTDDPCVVDRYACNPPAVQGDDQLANAMYMINGYKVTATLVGVDSYRDFSPYASRANCYIFEDACDVDNNGFGCRDCYATKGPRLANDNLRSATIVQPPTALKGDVTVRWVHAVGESISYRVRFDFYGTSTAVYRATSYQQKQTACAGEH
jgi:hypothetical protein